MKDDRKSLLKAEIAVVVYEWVNAHNRCDSIDMKLQLYKDAEEVLQFVQDDCSDLRYDICNAADM